MTKSGSECAGAHRISGPDACGEILLVGEDNPLSSDPRYALYHEPVGCSGHRLQSRILGLLPRQSYLPIWRTNLCSGGWRVEAARARAEALVTGLLPWRIIVMLGARVSGAFSSLGDPALRYSAFEVDLVFGRSMIYLPHPSGRNRIWNNQSSVDIARDLLRLECPGVPWGEADDEATRS